MYDKTILEEELKNKVAADYFADFDNTQIIGKIDFSIAVPTPKDQPSMFETEFLLWAEAKKGTKENIYHSLTQLVLTIGKARTFDKFLPPAFLGAFDAEKIAFVPYHKVMDVFYQNDFNWNVTPSDHETREFRHVLSLVTDILNRELLIFHYDNDRELRRFIRQNFVVGKREISQIQITTNNFISIFQKWQREVKPTIAIDWNIAKKEGLISADFFLADLLSEHNQSLKESLYVLLRGNYYRYNIQRRATGSISFEQAEFNDQQVAHTQFWNRYRRPPKRQLWDELVERRDLLVPQDVRERKGSFFTPQIWVERSQEYLADVLGETWQDDYYIWDCCAGTGNLLNGLKDKYRIFASTLDQADVDVMHDRIRGGANLLDSHVFQFDFLNDDFLPNDQGGKLPTALYNIITDPEQRKKLVIYINPPYAEAGNKQQYTGNGENKAKTSTDNKTYLKYKKEIGRASNELFAQFFIRIYREIPGAMLAEFSKLKILQASNFADFRKIFQPKLEKMFVVPAKTFDNVTGSFPIGFFIWNTTEKEKFLETKTDIYEKNGDFLGTKSVYSIDISEKGSMNNWLNVFKNYSGETKSILMTDVADFQKQNFVALVNEKSESHQIFTDIKQANLIPLSVYFAVRQCIEATWLNDRDQFLYPNNGWQADREFQADCLAFTLFHGQNRIQGAWGEKRPAFQNNAKPEALPPNHWIPFTEQQVDARERFASHFMSDFIAGRCKNMACHVAENTLFSDECDAETWCAASLQSPYNGTQKIEFSPEAQAVYDAGLALWRYYHAQPAANPNASFYDIRRHFQGVSVGANGKERMNNDSPDATYNALIKDLRDKLKLLARKIEPKVYEYGFLK